MIDVDRILELHRQTVDLWHRQEMANPYEGMLRLVCEQHAFNFQLWHEEDVARSRDASDAQLAQVKRNIDRYNQQRNDGIERIDDWITESLRQAGVRADATATMNTETPGTAIDRLSILSLRMYHLQEQTERADVDQEHIRSVTQKLLVCRQQLDDLAAALALLLQDIYAGRKRHKTYRQFKMYNDPTLNPYLYQSPSSRRAG